MSDKTPEEDGYYSIVIITNADLRFLTDMMTWLREEWLSENQFDAKDSIIRNTPEGYYEIMAKPKQ